MAAFALLITACTPGAGDDDKKSSGPPQTHGRLTVLTANDPPGFSPYSGLYVGVADGGYFAAVYDMLVWSDASTGSVHMQMADSLTPDTSYKVWTLRLKPGIAFSDGTPFDAAAVKYNWERHADPTTGSHQEGAARGLVLSTVDATTLRITLPSPNANFDQVVAHSLSFIVSPTALRSNPRGLDRQPVGAGPFVLKEWLPGDHVTLVRNPHYWQTGRPYLDEVVFKISHDTARAASAVSAGDGDITVASDAAAAAQAPHLGLLSQELHLSGGYMVAFNTRKPPFDDPRARRAVALALDEDEINSQVFHGAGRPAHGIFSADTPLANNQLRADNNRPEEARRLFAELAAEGKRISFTYLSIPLPGFDAFQRYLREKLSGYPGVSVSVETLETPELGARLARGDFEASFWAEWIAQPDPGIHAFVRSDGGGNITGYASPVVDGALDMARKTREISERREWYTAAQVQINRDVPFFVYQESVSVALYTDRVENLTLTDDGVILFDNMGRRP